MLKNEALAAQGLTCNRDVLGKKRDISHVHGIFIIIKRVINKTFNTLKNSLIIREKQTKEITR